MAWITLTEAHLLTKISGPELAQIREAALGEGQVDPVQPTLDQVTREVRGRVAACARNRLGAGNTIPDELLDAALSLAVLRFEGRAAGLSIDENSVRANAARSAESLLRDVARCEFSLEQPDSVSTEVIAAPAPSFGTRTREFTRERQDG